MAPPPRTLEFWFEFASPYCYLTAPRIEALAAAAGVTIAWRAFLLGPVFQKRAHNPSVFQGAPPPEARYRQRDVERLCVDYGLPLRWPSRYPRTSLLAARVALIAADEGWAAPFTKAVFHANFAEDRDIAEPAVVAPILRALGRDPDAVIARATTDTNKARLKGDVEQAIALGIFGAPSFITADGELFWGNDRLEPALAWASRGASPAA
jgi:2-hydroxychromene-2-carboxylate isomerase